MKLANLYEKIAEIKGLKMEQEFNVVSSKGLAVSLFNPYRITEWGIVDAEGDFADLAFIDYMLDGQIKCEPIVKPLLTEEEKTCLINLCTICGNIDTITIVEENVGWTVMYCVNDCEVTVADFVVAPGLFDKLKRNREYTWKELGLED